MKRKTSLILTWVETKIWRGPASAKKPICSTVIYKQTQIWSQLFPNSKNNTSKSLDWNYWCSVLCPYTTISIMYVHFSQLHSQFLKFSLSDLKIQKSGKPLKKWNLIDNSDSSLKNLSYKRHEYNTLIRDWENGKSSYFANLPFSNIINSNDRHNKPMPSAAQ